MNAATASTSSSSFAALLKQSKFASYSPAIAQVYTTHGGHAKRGDWGFKRPLSVRKRNHALIVHSVDSREQQTEFRSGELESMMVKRWAETGMDVNPAVNERDARAWITQYGQRPSRDLAIDSEFCAYTPEPETAAIRASPALQLKAPSSLEAMPNLQLMSEKEFNRYLQKVRKLRPAFRRYIQEHGLGASKEGEQDETYLYEMRSYRQGDNIARDFINEVAYQLHGSANSQTLEPYPHRNGGLYFPKPNAFQTSLSHPPIPARFTSSNPNHSTQISAAGLSSTIISTHSDKVKPLDWHGDYAVTGQAPIRFSSATLLRGPEAVTTSRSESTDLSFSAVAGRTLRQNQTDLTEPPFTHAIGLKAMSVSVTPMTVKDQQARTNPHPPGSIPYSLYVDSRARPKSRDGPRAPAMARAVEALTTEWAATHLRERRQHQETMVDNLNHLLTRVAKDNK